MKIKGEITTEYFNTPLLVINEQVKIKSAKKNNKITLQSNESN